MTRKEENQLRENMHWLLDRVDAGIASADEMRLAEEMRIKLYFNNLK